MHCTALTGRFGIPNLKYLLKVENTFKTVIAHEFSAQYGHDNYLKIENFEISILWFLKVAVKSALSNFKKLAKGNTEAEIAEVLEEPEDVIHTLCERAAVYSPDFDEKKI